MDKSEAKNKALQLIDSFNEFSHSNPQHDSELFYRRLKKNSIECSLITVEEILKSQPSYIYWET